MTNLRMSPRCWLYCVRVRFIKIMEVNIKKGDKIRIKENLMDELVRCGFNKEEMKSFVKRFKGKTVKALDVYQDVDKEFDGVKIEGSNEWYVTVELCCEVPLNACELVGVY